MEKMGEDAFHITKVHGENGTRSIPHNKSPWRKCFHITKVHGENATRSIPHNKSPWRK